MKKEIKKMLTLGNTKKSLKLNCAFELVADYIDNNGRNVEVSKHEPVDMTLSLVYVLAHDKCLGKSKEIISRNVDDVIAEIQKAMHDIINDVRNQLVNDFKNGYLLGEVRETHGNDVKYYEVEFGKSEKPDDNFSMCILGRRMPSVDEAKEYLAETMELLGYNEVTKVLEITSEEAYNFFDMDNEANFPVFE